MNLGPARLFSVVKLGSWTNFCEAISHVIGAAPSLSLNPPLMCSSSVPLLILSQIWTECYNAMVIFEKSEMTGWSLSG